MIRERPAAALAVAGNTYFWYLAALIVLVVVIYGTEVLGLSALRTSYLQAAMALGIGAGSVAAGYASRKQIEYGFVPLGAAGIAVCLRRAFAAADHVWRVFTVACVAGIFCGIFCGAD